VVVDFGNIDMTAIDPDLVAKPMTISISLAGTTQHASQFAVNHLEQNGLPTGTLSSVDVDTSGVVFAKYTNGYTKPLGQVALANFSNKQGLDKLSGNVWEQAPETGAVNFGKAGISGFGDVRSSSLETSNVDLSQELVKLIIAQQAYQANSQAISIQKTLTESVLRI
jgi:flagellar hook protein FlgE